MPERLAQRKRHALEKSCSQWIQLWIKSTQMSYRKIHRHSPPVLIRSLPIDVQWCAASKCFLLAALEAFSAELRVRCESIILSLSAQTNNSMPVSDSVKGSWMRGTAQYIAHTCATPGTDDQCPRTSEAPRRQALGDSMIHQIDPTRVVNSTQHRPAPSLHDPKKANPGCCRLRPHGSQRPESVNDGARPTRRPRNALRRWGADVVGRHWDGSGQVFERLGRPHGRNDFKLILCIYRMVHPNDVCWCVSRIKYAYIYGVINQLS